MIEDFIVQMLDLNILYGVMAGVTVLGILLRLGLLGFYKGLIRSAAEMATTEKVWIKQLRLRFETLFKLRIGINSVKAFVERHVCQKKFMGIFLTTWERICRQSIVLNILLGSIGSILCIVYGRERMEAVFYVSAGVWLAMLSLMADDLAGFADRRRKLENVMYDYLENILRIRLEKEFLNDDAAHMEQKELIAASGEQENSHVVGGRRERRAHLRAERRQKKDELRRIKLEKAYAKKCARAEKKKRRLEEKLSGGDKPAGERRDGRKLNTYAEARKAELLAEKQSRRESVQKQEAQESPAKKQSVPGAAGAEAAVTVDEPVTRSDAAADRGRAKGKHDESCIEESLIDDVLKEFFTS